jgi:hypothetical protein
MFGVVKAPETLQVDTPASFAFIQINSRDRNTATGTPSKGSFGSAEYQPWNDFRCQKPAPMLDAFARRIGATEILFPWAIPNITPRNNSLVINMDIFGANQEQVLTIAPGFYTGTSLATAMNTAINALPSPLAPNHTERPEVSFDTTLNQFTIEGATSGGYAFHINMGLTPALNSAYFTSASLVKTMGIAYNQLNTNYQFGADDLVGYSTRVLYTSYVDITSEKLHTYNEINDGTTSTSKSVNAVLCRLYCGDETSGATSWNIGQTPFVIHRQYRTPKMLKWSPDAFVDWFGIQIYDEYGELVYVPPPATVATPPKNAWTYPDWSMTLVATED